MDRVLPSTPALEAAAVAADGVQRRAGQTSHKLELAKPVEMPRVC